MGNLRFASLIERLGLVLNCIRLIVFVNVKAVSTLLFRDFSIIFGSHAALLTLPLAVLVERPAANPESGDDPQGAVVLPTVAVRIAVRIDPKDLLPRGRFQAP